MMTTDFHIAGVSVRVTSPFPPSEKTIAFFAMCGRFRHAFTLLELRCQHSNFPVVRLKLVDCSLFSVVVFFRLWIRLRWIFFRFILDVQHDAVGNNIPCETWYDEIIALWWCHTLHGSFHFKAFRITALVPRSTAVLTRWKLLFHLLALLHFILWWWWGCENCIQRITALEMKEIQLFFLESQMRLRGKWLEF